MTIYEAIIVVYLEGCCLGTSSHSMIVRVHQGKCSAVKGNAQDGLFGDRAPLHQVLQRVVHVEEQVLTLLVFPGIEGSIMSGLAIPFTVIIVAHDMNIIQILVHLGNVVGHVDGGGGSPDGGGQKEPVGIERQAEVADEIDEELLVVGRPAPLPRILPVEVEAVKVVLLQEAHDAVDKVAPLVAVGHHGRILLAALVPAPDGQGDFQMGVGILQVGGLPEALQRIVVLQIHPRVQGLDLVRVAVEAGETVDQVGAQ